MCMYVNDKANGIHQMSFSVSVMSQNHARASFNGFATSIQSINITLGLSVIEGKPFSCLVKSLNVRLILSSLLLKLLHIEQSTWQLPPFVLSIILLSKS